MLKQILTTATLFSSLPVYALPFIITPQGNLPSQVISGWASTAYYTVTNNTVTTRNNNYVKYLPPNVTQVTSDASVSNLCGATFTLGPNGSPAQSCTLELNVTGAVDPADPDPHHHLFVCFEKGDTCAGPKTEIDVPASSVVAGYGELIAGGVVTINDPVSGNQESLPAIWASRLVNGTSQQTFVYDDLSNVFAQLGVVGGIVGGTTPNALLISVIPNRPMGCSGLLCVASGVYNVYSNSPSPTNYALMLYSTTAGQKWNAVNPSIITAATQGSQANTAVCSGSVCLFGGNYSTDVANTFPFLVVSTDGTKTWNTIDVTGVYTNENGGSIDDASCSGSVCIADGFYYQAVNNLVLPLLVVSQDQGKTFFPIVVKELPPTFYSGFLMASGCTGSTCIAVGGYQQTSTDKQEILVVRSTDNGSTWKFVDMSSLTPATSMNFIYGGCSGTACAIGGTADFFNPGQNVFLLGSSDAGATWTAASGLPSPAEVPIMNGVTCNGSICTAVGYSYTNVGETPFVFVSTDSAATWTQATLPSETGSFFQSACVSTICIAAGSKSSSGTLFNITYDSGTIWTQSDLDALVPNLVDGYIYTVAGT